MLAGIAADHTHDKPTLYVQACAAAKKAIQSFQEFTGNVSDEFFFPVSRHATGCGACRHRGWHWRGVVR